MKKVYILLTLVVALALGADAQYKAGYYNKMDGKKREALKQAAKECVQNHTRLVYTDLPNYWQYTDVYPELVNGQKRWWDMYSDVVYLIKNGQNARQSFSANKMQREHSIPKSWWKKNNDVEYTPAYSDMWNLYPSDGAANQAKLNYPFGITRSTTYNNGVTKVGPAQTGYGGGSNNVFEPGDEYKGDFARAIFYMATVYNDLPWVINYMFQTEDYPTLRSWAVDMLLQWSRTDKVSQKEIDRNNLVEQYQGNRNPFVDFPELAEYIWGTRTTETFVLADQETSDPTPPITGDPELDQPINGEWLDFGQIAVGYGAGSALQIVGRNMTEPLTLMVSGTNKSFFMPSVTSIPAATINANGGYLLNITYRPTSVGQHEAKLILLDGGLPATYVVNLKGEALEVPTMETLHANEATNVTSTGYTANWDAPSGIADYYLLTRVRYIDGKEEADTYETGDTSYTITDRDPDIAESYTVSYYRLGLQSPASNSIYIAASGINDPRVESPLIVYGIEGGILVSRCNGEGGVLRVYDMSGSLLIEEASAADGAFYSLGQGIYVVTVGGGRPQKVVVK